MIVSQIEQASVMKQVKPIRHPVRLHSQYQRDVRCERQFTFML